MRVPSAIAAAGALTVGLAAPLQAQTPQDLKALTIEELMDIDVTVASRRPEPVRAAAAAVSVITRDDIRRSGATTIADALWLAAGVHVARLNNGVWAFPCAASTFEVRLPSELPDAAFGTSLDTSPRALPPADVDPRLLRGVYVLVVDDEEDARELLRTTLESYGASVAAAGACRKR